MARRAKSLDVLLAEVNAWAPKRSKRSDGWIGDPAHASRASRHNPNDAGVVCAVDITHDPAGGCDIHGLARRLVLNPHPDLEYVISNGEVAKRRTGFAWEPYRNTNPHDKHAHFAVGRGSDAEPIPPYDTPSAWGVSSEQSEQDEDMYDVEYDRKRDDLDSYAIQQLVLPAVAALAAAVQRIEEKVGGESHPDLAAVTAAVKAALREGTG